jgi:hypothetical protein
MTTTPFPMRTRRCGDWMCVVEVGRDDKEWSLLLNYHNHRVITTTKQQENIEVCNVVLTRC